MLRQVASRGALLVLDDLHAADPDSLEAIRYVASARVDGLAVVAALRPAESAVADEVVRALRGDDAAAVIELEPLGQRAVGDLVTHLLDAAPPAELVAGVLAQPADLDSRLAALDIKARALDFLGQRAAAAQAWSAQAAEAGAADRTQARLRALFQLGKQEFFAGGRPACRAQRRRSFRG